MQVYIYVCKECLCVFVCLCLCVCVCVCVCLSPSPPSRPLMLITLTNHGTSERIRSTAASTASAASPLQSFVADSLNCTLFLQAASLLQAASGQKTVQLDAADAFELGWKPDGKIQDCSSQSTMDCAALAGS